MREITGFQKKGGVAEGNLEQANKPIQYFNRFNSLTSHIMKVMVRLVLTHRRPLVSPSLDPMEFAYQPQMGVDDAIIFLLQRAT